MRNGRLLVSKDNSPFMVVDGSESLTLGEKIAVVCNKDGEVAVVIKVVEEHHIRRSRVAQERDSRGRNTGVSLDQLIVFASDGKTDWYSSDTVLEAF